jgi:hypothetical protein
VAHAQPPRPSQRGPARRQRDCRLGSLSGPASVPDGVAAGGSVSGAWSGMTANGNLKRRVRARVAKTGESYTSALRYVRSTGAGAGPPVAARLRLAVARTAVSHDPRDSAGLRRGGQEVRAVMRQAHAGGARLVHFPEGAMVFPHKRIMSADGPDTVGPAEALHRAWVASV